MAETPVAESANAEPVQSIETDLKQEDVADDKSDEDAEAEEGEGGEAHQGVSSEQYKALKNIAEILTNYSVKVKGDDEHYPSLLFRRIPNRRNLPDYHEIIKEPVALSTLKGKIQRKQYTGIPEFVRDFALIVHNAQVYNLPNSAPVRDVLVLQDVFKEELNKLVSEGLAKEEETEFPDLGEIPYATPEPDPVSDDDEDNDDDGEDDDDDDDADDSDDDRRRRRGRRGARPSISGRKSRGEDDDKLDDGDVRKRRGRPPRVDTPMEARIKAVLKGLRKQKDTAGNPKVRNFERLPDKAEYPAYFVAITDPIALDSIKKKSKRKKYQSLEQFMKDIDLLFNNAKHFNEEGSEIYNDAVELQAEAHKLLDIEKAKPDDVYLLEDGRRPLPSGILYKNELWKVGDWIHIANPNDITKPIIAQIYRTWEDSDGQKWINACWYYRPEQTIHQHEKHFFPNEVVKTGQYRDHKIEEVVDRCFVMFVTRYSRGRPRGVDPSKEVYVCEARYNEEKHRFNKIKTWASCLPDEVRDKDYEMDLFDQPRRIKKVPSPLKHLLKDDMKETDEIPSPQWGHPNAPPILGAIHKHPREENQSPPPEPTPPPPPTPPQPVRQPSLTSMAAQPIPRPSMDRTPSVSGSSTTIQPPVSRPSLPPQMTPYQPQSISPAPSAYSRQPSYPQSQTPIQAAPTPKTPATQQPTPYAARQQLHPQPHLTASHPTNYSVPAAPQSYQRPPTQSTPAYNQYAPQVSEPRGSEVYVLSNIANESIPKHIRDNFPQDDEGRVLFFTKPPTLPDPVVRGRDGQPLAHTEKYLAAKAERDKLIAARRREREEMLGSAKRRRIEPVV
ncbi:hypothetical protein PV08_10340 [Exophiala spinifera]|uniref:Chromatin structure-remodeling complex subunit RSC1 n=1 Tax=Exophiala spinifera TaxID=91928 RepID=A0A0D1Y7Z6_9EURO|nr:uncharacterized protein PV08_10340 [Exophiala spinifera]KIW11041.1 hypothetical protein PV08_10340 [Exophiala spinifera]